MRINLKDEVDKVDKVDEVDDVNDEVEKEKRHIWSSLLPLLP